MTLSRREHLIIQLCSPGMQGDLLHQAQQILPQVLETLGLEPTNSDELKNLILEMQSARSLTAFQTYRKITRGEVSETPRAKILQALWLTDVVMIHLETEANEEEIWQVMTDLLETPGSENVRVLVTRKEENASLTTLTDPQLKELGVQRIPEGLDD